MRGGHPLHAALSSLADNASDHFLAAAAAHVREVGNSSVMHAIQAVGLAHNMSATTMQSAAALAPPQAAWALFGIVDPTAGEVAYVTLALITSVGNFIFMLVLGAGALVYVLTQNGPPALPPSSNKKDDKSEALIAASSTGSAAAASATAAAVRGCTVLVPCLLDHEADIIEETLHRALAVPHVHKVVLSYNTRKGSEAPPELLARLEGLAKDSKGRLVVVANPHSTSKADNMNGVLSELSGSEHTLILDADHHIDSHFVCELSRTMAEAPDECVCVQGAVLVRGDSCYEHTLWLLNWHFFSLLLPVLHTISGSCMFVGAGALWRTTTLQAFRFDHGMIAEDDDLSMRVIRKGLAIYPCPTAQLTELAPANLGAFCSQRLRWTFGYEQSLNRHVCGLVCERPRALMMR